jgi:hypothetical protein
MLYRHKILYNSLISRGTGKILHRLEKQFKEPQIAEGMLK